MAQSKDDMTPPHKSAVMAKLIADLEDAKKKLQKKIAEKDEKGIATMKKIVANLTQTVARG